MDHFAGLDVSVKETSVCVVDDTGRIVREVKVASEPEALLPVLRNPAYHFKRIGLEAGPLSQWLYSALADADLPVICVETRHMRAVLQAQINKTDRNDARGMAQMMRAGLYRPVHVKTLRSQKLRMLLTHRKLLQSKAIAIENDLRGTLRNFGLKVSVVGAVKFEARIQELVENLPDLGVLVEPLLIVRRTLREQIGILHRRLLAIVRDDEVCRRLMTVPGVGPVVALTYRATVDVPARFRNSKAVGAVFGLTPSKYQSGEINRTGGISRCGDEMMRVMLYEAAQVMRMPKTSPGTLDFAGIRWNTLACLEKVSFQFLSLHQDFRRPVTADADTRSLRRLAATYSAATKGHYCGGGGPRQPRETPPDRIGHVIRREMRVVLLGHPNRRLSFAWRVSPTSNGGRTMPPTLRPSAKASPGQSAVRRDQDQEQRGRCRGFEWENAFS
jgi:transposase